MNNSPRNQAQSSFKPISNLKAKKIILETGGYTCEPNELKDAWLNGTISNECYRLVSAILRHSEEFQLKDTYLMPRFGNHRTMLARAKSEAIARRMLQIEKIRVGRSFVMAYTLLDPHEWIYAPFSTVGNPTVENPTVGIPTPLRRTTPKKKKNKKTNDDEEYENASSLKGMDKWIAKLRPGEVVNLFKNNGLLPEEKNGYVNQIQDFNKAVRIAFANHSDDQIHEIGQRMANSGVRLPRDVDRIFAMLEALNPSEPKYESIEIYQNAIDEVQWPPNGESLDDCPY